MKCAFAPAVVLALVCASAAAQQEEWAGTYRCGPMKKDPDERPGYSSPAKLTVTDGTAQMSRDTGRIRESLTGKVAEDGRVVLEGTGHLKDSGASWRYRFEGRFEGSKFEASGSMYPPRGGGALRDCSMALTRISTRISATIERHAKAPPVEQIEAAPSPPPQREPQAKPPAPAPEVISPVVRAALESPAVQEEPARAWFLAGYSRNDLALLALFIVCAVAGVALLVYDWRRNHNRY